MLSSLLMSLVDATYETITRKNLKLQPRTYNYVDSIKNSLLFGLLTHLKLFTLDPSLTIIIDSSRMNLTIDVFSLVDAGVVNSNALGAYVTKYDPDEYEVAVVVSPHQPMYVDEAKVAIYSVTQCNVVTYMRTSLLVPENVVQTILSMIIPERKAIIEEHVLKKAIEKKAKVRLDPELR